MKPHLVSRVPSALALALALGAVMPCLGAFTATDKATSWLARNRIQQGLDKRTGIVTTIGVSAFDCPRNMLFARLFAACRDSAFDEAYRSMLAKQVAIIRKDVSHSEIRASGASEEGQTLREIFAKELRPWDGELGRFAYRSLSLTDLEDNEVAQTDARKFRWSSDFATSSDAFVQGLENVRTFESYDADEGVYEVAVVASQNPALQLDAVRTMEMAYAADAPKGSVGFDEWLASRNFGSLFGIMTYRDDKGMLWVVGAASTGVANPELAKKAARMRAAFAFGADVAISMRSVDVKDSNDSFFCKRESYDASRSVTGESYPDGMVEYRTVKGRHPLLHCDMTVVLCILRSGTRQFREQEFECNMKREIGSKFYDGKRNSLIELRDKIKAAIDVLSDSDLDRHRRDRLNVILENLQSQIDELDAQFNFVPSSNP